MYYMLECYGSPFEDATDLGEVPELPQVESWMAGRMITDPIPEPVRIPLDAENPGALLEMFKSDVLVMTDRLVAALEEAGVDNLQTYAAELVDPATNRVIGGYRLVNLVGVVSCAEIGARAEGGALARLDFDGAPIDARRARGFLMFRLAESLSAVVVRQEVRDHLLAKGFDMLTFVPPEEWIG